MKPIGKRLKQRILIGTVLVVALGAGGWAARTLAWPAFKTARTARMNREARAFLDAGDPVNALLVARKSLRAQGSNPEAWRVAAAASALRDRPDSIWYQDNLCRDEPTLENRLAFLRLALRLNVPRYAIDMIAAMAEQARDDEEFHRLAARIQGLSGNSGEVRPHLVELLRLAPGDVPARIELAALELAADPGRRDETLRARVLALADSPASASAALALLLRENIASRHLAGTADLVRRLRLVPAPDFSVRMLIAEALAFCADPEAPSLLAELRTRSADNPGEAAALIALMARLDQVAAITSWTAELPSETRKNEEVRVAQAEALLDQRDFPGLATLLRDERWATREHLRGALLARACREQGLTAEFNAAWRLALDAAGSDRARLLVLLARADDWRWAVERHEVVWKLFALDPANLSLQRMLLLWESRIGDTAALHRLFTRIVEISPDDEAAQNNLAYTGLLLDVGVGPAGLLAGALADRHPQDPYYATTRAFARYKAGDAAGALAALESLSAAERSEPARLLLHALCLVALGRDEAAGNLFDGLVVSGLLPEERRLAEDGRAVLAQRHDSPFVRAHPPASAAGSGNAGWLGVIDETTRGAATKNMRLADSLHAAADWEGIRRLLGTDRWGNAEYLRSALLADALRRSGQPVESRDAWLHSLALAGRNQTSLRNLNALAGLWTWQPEHIETLNLVLASAPEDRRVMEELLRHYLESGRTAEALRVLGVHLAATSATGEETVAHAYYSLLLDTELARAEVNARIAFDASPAVPFNRMVQAFSLLKQRRPAEALALLGDAPDARGFPGLKPAPLLRAVVLARLDKKAEARLSLARFDLESALPEEARLAASLARELEPPVETLTPPRI